MLVWTDVCTCNDDVSYLPLRSGKSILHCFLKLLGLFGERREPSLVKLLGRDMFLSTFNFSKINPDLSNFLFYFKCPREDVFSNWAAAAHVTWRLTGHWQNDLATCHPVVSSSCSQVVRCPK